MEDLINRLALRIGIFIDETIERIKDEPVMVMALIEALVGLVTVFGLDLTAAQSTQILVVVGAVLALVARQKVTPTRKVSTK